jgi:hypothetical protein
VAEAKNPGLATDKGQKPGFFRKPVLPRNRVSSDNLCHQPTTLIETRFLAPVSCPGFFFAEVKKAIATKLID